MNGRLGVWMLGLCLAGCAAPDNLDVDLHELIGTDIHLAVLMFGAPDGNPPLAGGQTYVWTSDQESDVTVYRFHEVLGSGPGAAIVRPNQYTYKYTETHPCTFQLTTDQNDLVKSYQSSGEGCSQYFAMSQMPVFPKPTYQVAPGYPDKELKAHVEGEVEIRFTVTSDGKVKDPTIVRSTPDGVFDDVALSAFRQWRYRPGSFNGQLIDVPRRYALIRFKLDHSNKDGV